MKIKVQPFFETIIALCIILDCESVWKWMHHSGYFRLALVACFILPFVVLYMRKRVKLFRHDETMFGFIFLYLMIFFIYNAAFNPTHLLDTLQFVTIIVLMVLYFKDDTHIESVMQRCSKILAIIACVSLFFWLFGSILHIFTPSQELTVYTSDVPIIRRSYFYLHYEIQREELLGGTIYRNTGIFYEGPKYVLLLAMVLSYELFLTDKPAYKRCIIFSITALSTFSMTGIYAIGLIWIMFFFTMFSTKTTKGLFFRIAFVLVLFLVGTQVVSYVEDMFNLKASTASFSTRMDNYQAGFEAWKEHLIMGAGYLNMETVMAHYSSFRLNDVGFSNSVFRVLAQGGLYLSIIYLIPMLKMLTSGINRRNGKLLAFLLIYLYFFITTSFPYNYINYMALLLMYFGMHEYSVSDVAIK